METNGRIWCKIFWRNDKAMLAATQEDDVVLIIPFNELRGSFDIGDVISCKVAAFKDNHPAISLLKFTPRSSPKWYGTWPRLVAKKLKTKPSASGNPVTWKAASEQAADEAACREAMQGDAKTRETKC